MMIEPLLLPSSSQDEERSKPSAGSFSFVFRKAKSVLRLKFLMVGLVLGLTVELLLVLKSTKVMKGDGEQAAFTAYGDVTIPFENHEANNNSQAHIQWFLSGCFWHEISYLCADVLLVTYLFLLARHTRNAWVDTITANNPANTNTGRDDSCIPWAMSSPVGWEHAVAASNFLTGVVLGAMTTLTTIFGPKILPTKLPHAILAIFVGIFTCFLAKATMLATFAAFASWKSSAEDEDHDEQKKGPHQYEGPPPSYSIASIVRGRSQRG